MSSGWSRQCLKQWWPSGGEQPLLTDGHLADRLSADDACVQQ